MISQYKDVYWNKKARDLVEALDSVHYGEFDGAQMVALRELTHIVYPATYKDRNWKKNGFEPGSHQEYIYQKLENAFFKGEVDVMLNKLLHDYERYELLAILIKM
jgi:hypothetical protein